MSLKKQRNEEKNEKCDEEPALKKVKLEHKSTSTRPLPRFVLREALADAPPVSPRTMKLRYALHDSMPRQNGGTDSDEHLGKVTFYIDFSEDISLFPSSLPRCQAF